MTPPKRKIREIALYAEPAREGVQSANATAPHNAPSAGPPGSPAPRSANLAQHQFTPPTETSQFAMPIDISTRLAAPLLFNDFIEEIAKGSDLHSPGLRFASEGRLAVQYAPFEWVEPSAAIMVVGITPGATQAAMALAEARRLLAARRPVPEILRGCRKAAGFSGDMRPNLVAMLDHVGLGRRLGIDSCELLFAPDCALLQTASALPLPTFVGGERYNGTPKLLRSPMLRELMIKRFVPLLEAASRAQLIALGPVVSEALGWLVERGLLDGARVLGEIPHPSPANRERINAFCGVVRPGGPSAKTNLEKIVAMRERMKAAVAAASWQATCSDRRSDGSVRMP